MTSSNSQSSIIKRPLTGRFAPSPTGLIHAGTIFAALQAWLISKSTGGDIVLRIEDLDAERSKQEFIDAILRDYEELGLSWDRGPIYQHDRQEAYHEAFKKLAESNNIYPCFCTRADLRSASAPHLGDTYVYDRRCRKIDTDTAFQRIEELARKGRKPAYRIEVPNETIAFCDLYQNTRSCKLAKECGDFILRRADGGFAYQLAVVVDDAEQGVDIVARGYDLLISTPKQIFLQDALDLDHPIYAHFPLFCATDGRRLAKRNKDASFEELKAIYGSSAAVLGHIAYIGGLQSADEPTTPEDLLKRFDIYEIGKLYKDKISINFR